MCVIILNCVTLGMYQPCNDEVCNTVRCQLLEGFDHFIFAFFAIEMVIKMVAMGVWGKDTYLAEAWNRLDCFIVVAGSIEYAVDTENLSISAIRTIRVLRPLRAINRIPSMRILVMLLLDTLPMLGNVLLLCFFVFFIFGIIGVQLWSGVLRHRCFMALNESYPRPSYVPDYYTPSRGKTEYICSSENNSGIRTCDASSFPLYEYEGIKCNGSARMDSDNSPTNDSCVNWNQYYTKCEARGENPFKGAVSFDNIGLAWVAIFQVISLESWVNIMYYVQDAHSFWDFTYFVALIVIGSFFMINLCLVVIATQFSETKKRETERMMQERKRFQSCSTLASNSEPGGCYTELLKLVAQVYRRVKRKVIKFYYKTRGLQKINPEKSLSLRRKKAKRKGSRHRSSSAYAASVCGGPSGHVSSSFKSSQQQQPQHQQSLQHNSSSSASASSRHQSFSYPVPTTVHHHQHQHLVPSPSPQPQQQHQQHAQSTNPHTTTQQSHPDNTRAPSIRRSSLSRPPSSFIVQAPTASPEQSDIDSMSSPRCPNFLALPSSPYSPLHPSSDSLAALSHLSVDAAFVPALLLKSPHPPNSPNQLGFPAAAAPMSLSRASSYNSGVSSGGARGPMPSLPEVLAAQGAKNAALAASNMLLNLDYEPSKSQSLADKGLFADNLLMDMVGDGGNKQINAQLSLQGGTNEGEGGASPAVHNHQLQQQQQQQQHPDNQTSGSCSGSGGGCSGGGNGAGGGCSSMSKDGKEFAGELQPITCTATTVTSSAVNPGSCTAVVPAGSSLYSGHSGGHSGPSAVVIAPGACEDYDSDVELSRDESSAQSRSSNICEVLSRLQKKLRRLVESTIFQRSILLAILLNTLSMAVEHHNQPELLTLILEYSNIVFCVLFGTEMAFKIISYGVFGYISNGFNVFDSFIVILSIVELAQGGASGLSVLRTFRLLRILKLVRFMPALRRQLVVMLRTMDNVATFFALLVLFMFIFSILGMNLFGGTFCESPDGMSCSCQDRKNVSIGCVCDRANFDNLIWSLVTVFQVLTQEDWNTVLYNGMYRTSQWASLYFIALMTFGNYVLFNLLVAILVEGFSTEDEDKRKDKNREEDDEDEDDEEGGEGDEEEQEKRRLAENNNIDDVQLPKSPINSVDLDVKNNKEKEKKMLALPAPPSSTSSTEQAQLKTPMEVSSTHLSPNVSHEAGTRNPPIITHTAATPMATPQGSPNENAIKDTNNHKMSLAVKRSALKSTLSVDSEKSTSFRGGSPRPSPCLRRNSSRGSTNHNRSASWRARHRRLRGDKTSLVVDSQSDSADEVEDDVFTSGHSQSPTYSAGTPRAPSVNTHGDCNGHPPLNNQRTLSPQNSLKGRALTPRNSFKSGHSWSRNNSVGSGRSICNSFELSRQNSFTSHRTLNSLGSCNSKEDNRSTKNFVDLPDVKIALDKEEGREEEEEEEEPDPDAIDETDWNCSWLPEPTGCFLSRHEYSFYLLSNENKIRKCCHHLISRRWFDNAVLFFIALNCITLAMERPHIPPDSAEREFLTFSNYIFTVVFTSEMAVKVIAKGLVVGKHAYLKSGWNVMDGFLVIISLIDIFISLTAASSPKIFGILRVFRLLRTLRPLRVISRAPGLKLVVQTLLSSLRPIGNIVLICCTFFIIFGILGVQLFKGTFYYCKGPDVELIQNRSMCLAVKGNEWINQKYNFDNLGMALMALFVLASKDGWVQIMYTGLDAVGVDQQPRENYNEWRLIFFISFLLLVAFFVLNMFVGVVVENFHKCRESQEIEERAKRAAKRQEKLDKKRKSEENSKSAASQEMREPPYWANYSTSRLLIHTVINSKYFDLAIAAVIGLNVITMAMEYYQMPEELKFALKIFNFFFTSVFILEAAMKIVALGFYRYIKDRWNQLDIMIVILSIVGIILEEMRTNVIPINPTIIRVMRVLRIARVLKLLKMAKGIRALLDTVIQALPQVGNLGLLFFLLFFIFAALGVELFGRLECSNEHPCEGLGVHAHFQHFGLAFLTLFRVATGDNWNGIMKDTLRDKCDRSDNCLKNCCVSPIIAPVYFVVFVLMAQFVLVNVVVAVLMKHLEETYKYKELDDELEEELQAEMCALALAGKAPPDGIEIKETHKMMDEEAILLDEALAAENAVKIDSEGPENGSGGDKPGGLQMSTLPSFSFSVRPPSEEQTRSEDTGALSPVNASLTIECMASSWSSMDSNRLGVSPGSMTATSGSSPCSERSVRISSPPIRRAPSPYLLSLQGGGNGGGTSGGPYGHHYNHPRHHHPSGGQQRVGLLGASLSGQRRPLVKQYSMDVGSDPQLNNLPLNSSLPDVYNGQANNSKSRSGLPPYYPHCQQHIQQQQQEIQKQFRNRNQDRAAIYRSQPSLKDIKGGCGTRPTSGSLDSSNTSRTGDFSSVANSDRTTPARDRIKHKLLRSRSSGAKYSRFRDKYKQSNLNKADHLNNSDTSLAKEKGSNPGGKQRGVASGSNRTGSNDTGSDVEESVFSDWGSEEAACDLEVKMITGGTEDEEDDIRPTLSPYASIDATAGPGDGIALGNRRPSAVESTGSSSASTPRGENTPHVIKQPSHPKCKSPMPPALKATGNRRSSMSSGNHPGIDNTSFEMGEEVGQHHSHPQAASYRVPCKSPRPSGVRRSNSFSPSKLTPKAFSPPMITARSDRSSHSPYQSISPLALPPSPLALEDSTYKLRTPEGGMTSSGHSPVPFSHSNMLTVPSPHSLYPHMRSPSPTPSKQVHLALPAVELGPPGGNTSGGGGGGGIMRRQPSPAFRRQQTLSRSFAVDESGPLPSPTSPSTAASSSISPSSSLRRRIPHTLSVDSAFLAPPNLGHGSPYSINDPYLEVHAGCRAPSPLPSPRNSQQTLPGMFTRSTSPAVPVNPQHSQHQRSPSFSSPPLQQPGAQSGTCSPPPRKQQQQQLQQQSHAVASPPSQKPPQEQGRQLQNQFLSISSPPSQPINQHSQQQQQQKQQQATSSLTVHPQIQTSVVGLSAPVSDPNAKPTGQNPASRPQVTSSNENPNSNQARNTEVNRPGGEAGGANQNPVDSKELDKSNKPSKDNL